MYFKTLSNVVNMYVDIQSIKQNIKSIYERDNRSNFIENYSKNKKNKNKNIKNNLTELKYKI